MAVTRCTVCNGHKSILGLGNMVKKCHECKGIGFVSLITPQCNDSVSIDADKKCDSRMDVTTGVEEMVIIPANRRGRKPRNLEINLEV